MCKYEFIKSVQHLFSLAGSVMQIEFANYQDAFFQVDSLCV